ncbi:MAG: M10 family metallopeptidase C-terminal domain-containing protein, partial [Acidobacteria bacterium]|nr:M10 family metallopeptidase C-terminal domain-containing protein [Acidobacteriota bacterium]
MPSYLALRNDVPFVQVDENGNIVAITDHKSALGDGPYLDDSIAGVPSTIATHTEGTQPGSLSGTESGDVYEYVLTAGVTYTFAYRGTAIDGIEDPLLQLYDSTGLVLIATDDDGGAGRTAMITFTPTVTGTYLLNATSWYTTQYGDPSLDTGNYTIDVWTADSAHDAPGTLDGAVAIGPGTTFGHLNEAGDVDVYSIQLTAGTFYTFGYAGGVAGETDFDQEPGENTGLIELLDASGNVIASNINWESGISYFAADSGTYYVRVSGELSTMTGGYTLDVHADNPAEHGPLDSIDWRSANNVPFVDTDGDGIGDTAYVYFAPAGENFGETGDDGVTPLVTYGWQQWQIDGVMLALEQYEEILGVNYEITTDSSQATFRLMTSVSGLYGAYMYPQDPAYGTQQGIGVYNLASGGFGTNPSSLVQGGFSFGVILHEMGHGHGLAHPHDTGGGSEIMLGVTASTGSYGVYDLNQGVYTVMSYNDAWDQHPDGPSPGGRANNGQGWSGSLSAFDIAQLQERYGVHAYNTGDNVYTLQGVNAPGTFYETIWDSGGNDTIEFSGVADAQIDLLAATLDYSPTGGGVVSFVDGVWGGYTIANGVTIENATGGSGNDVLLGNDTANTLTGNAGDDTLVGRGGNDLLLGGGGVDTVTGGDGLDVATLGGGNDIYVAELDATKVDTKQGKMSVNIITDFDASGDDLIDLSNLNQAFTFRGTHNNKNDGDLTYKTYSSVAAAERALGIDIDGNAGAGGVSGPVTIVYGNVDGRDPDFAIILLNTSGVTADDFLFGTASGGSTAGTTGDGLSGSSGSPGASAFHGSGFRGAYLGDSPADFA